MNEIMYNLLISGASNNLKKTSKTMFQSALNKVISFAVKIKPELKLQIQNAKTKEEAAKALVKIKELIDFNAGGAENILSEDEFKAFEIISSRNIVKINIDRLEFINSKATS